MLTECCTAAPQRLPLAGPTGLAWANPNKAQAARFGAAQPSMHTTTAQHSVHLQHTVEQIAPQAQRPKRDAAGQQGASTGRQYGGAQGAARGGMGGNGTQRKGCGASQVGDFVAL